MTHRPAPLATLLMLACFGLDSPASAQITPPAPGVEVPEAMARTKAKDAAAYRFERAWLGTAARAAQQRRALQAADGVRGGDGDRLAKGGRAAVVGTYKVPVLTLSFADVAQPYSATALSENLFGPSPEPTLTDFYNEVSSGLVTMTGDVWGPTVLPHDDDYYAGTTRGLSPGNAKLGEMMKSALDTHDGVVDFGHYDNDGPDGIPNSGDDDGYVDFVAFVHSEQGAECGGNQNIWSHRWVYGAWPAAAGAPYQTNDASANGGTILVWDYTVQPSLSCLASDFNETPIEIGVFCHEFGHAFGLPDLYDNNGGGAGLGEWCLMSSGNWNVPSLPAHMSAWCKRELGWVNSIPVTWQGARVDIEPVETSGTIYELPLRDDRWGRRDECPLSGENSLAVGISDGEIVNRGWVGRAGYGNRWRETVAHDFGFDGVGPVSLAYRYAVESEDLYDFALVVLESAGEETVLAAYDGVATGEETVDLTALLGTQPGEYRVKFRFVSDEASSAEDGGYLSSCVPFIVDDVRVTGGGENHHADFEDHRNGWYTPRTEEDNPVSEMWLVENRQPLGFDLHLHGTGLMVYHLDQEVLDSNLGNSGGRGNATTRGIVVEEADGEGHLLTGSNRGDGGDAWPGTAVATSFGVASSPSSASNGGLATPVGVSDIVAGPNGTIAASLVAGDPAPQFSAVTPNAGTGQLVVGLENAQAVGHGASIRLVRPGQAPVTGEVQWLDHHVVSAAFDLTGVSAGSWDIVVENPDGQTAVAAAAFDVGGAATSIPRRATGFDLAQNYPNPFNPDTTIRFQLPTAGPLRLVVYDMAGRLVRTLVNGSVAAGYHQVQWDGRNDAGLPVASGLYAYRMETADFAARRTMMLVK